MDVGTLQVVPSMLDVDQGRVAEALSDMEAAGADRVQWDVMDGSFVPRITHGPDLVAAVRSVSGIPFEAHLMVDNPERHWRAFADAGCEVVIVHAEATRHLHLLLQDMREAGVRAGVALNPATPLEMIVDALDLIDHVLVMTVNPGRGGQKFIASMLPKIRAARELIDGADLPIDLEVDGGVAAATAPRVAEAGANLLVAGSAVNRHAEGRQRAIEEIHQEAQRGVRRRHKLEDEAAPEAEGAEPEGDGLSRGVVLFNNGQFWEAHEAWEGAWMPRRGSADADFFKGLVQVAAGSYHYQRHNREGALAKWRDGAGLLRPYLPVKERLDLQSLVASVDQLRSALAASESWPGLEMPRRDPAPAGPVA
ncbi:MAG: ribulose-phosphate 3-epimerase [Candidatus Dormibacteraeota bacterium]|nr:ribulose-phosphate 3-epimerase [Candidatus Dormibacteraeota bacterium]